MTYPPQRTSKRVHCTAWEGINSANTGQVDDRPRLALTHVRNDTLNDLGWSKKVCLHLQLHVIKTVEKLNKSGFGALYFCETATHLKSSRVPSWPYLALLTRTSIFPSFASTVLMTEGMDSRSLTSRMTQVPPVASMADTASAAHSLLQMVL